MDLIAKLKSTLSRPGFGKHLEQCFSGIYCINLDRRPDRWQRCEKHFRKFGLQNSVQRFSATDLRAEGYGHLERRQGKNLKYSVLSCCGCTLSHRRIVQQAKERGLESVLVFEDDAKILADNISHVSKTLQDLQQQPWEMFYFGATFNKALSRVTPHLLRAPEGAHATHAIAYHQRAYDKFLDLFSSDPEELIQDNRFKTNAIDVSLQSCGLFQEVYAADPIMIVQDPGGSDICDIEGFNVERHQMKLFREHRPAA